MLHEFVPHGDHDRDGAKDDEQHDLGGGAHGQHVDVPRRVLGRRAAPDGRDGRLDRGRDAREGRQPEQRHDDVLAPRGGYLQLPDDAHREGGQEQVHEDLPCGGEDVELVDHALVQASWCWFAAQVPEVRGVPALEEDEEGVEEACDAHQVHHDVDGPGVPLVGPVQDAQDGEADGQLAEEGGGDPEDEVDGL